MLWLYRLIGYLAAPFLVLRLLWRSRKNKAYLAYIAERFGWYEFAPINDVIWLHAVSVGEANAALPLVRRLTEQYPDATLLISCTTPTGRKLLENALRSTPAAHIAYLPFDLFGAARRFLASTRPRLGIIMETELWPNLVDLAHRQGTRLLIANARLSERSARGYARVSGLTRPMLQKIDHFSVQFETDAQRLQTLGAASGRITVTGNIKFDQPLSETTSEQAERAKAMLGKRPIWIAGSTHAGEDILVLQAFQQLRSYYPELLLVLAPRHPERFDEVAELINQKYTLQRRTGIAQSGTVSDDTDVFMLDTIGELPIHIAAADVAFIGGSLVPVGGHNVLEACAAGVPVVFGQYMNNFATIAAMVVKAGAGTQVDGSAFLAAAVEEYLQNPQFAAQAGRALMEENSGALDRVYADIDRLLTKGEGFRRN